MDRLVVVSLVLLVAWSAYSVMRSRHKARQKALLFYSEIIPLMDRYELKESRTQFPALTGSYAGWKVSLVPVVDNLVFQRLPRLYLRLYIHAPNTVLLRLRRLDFETQSNHLFIAGSFESSHREVRINDQDYRLFLGDGDYPSTLEKVFQDLLPAGNGCAEMLFQKSFIRVTVLLSKGNQSSYVMTRAADFDNLIFKSDFLQTYFQAVLELQMKLNQPNLNAPPNSDREVMDFAGNACSETS